ncbi:hypothetical protein N3K66_007985 [Trichothecium roseum]|uniref:Uncharacterized protein n=1 Tax=Trichothecium roseum TaxID=47278 RepID=A0ACC0USJ1_9HYPO|nr:hypothetical protein N3K66_007985 [Trichothecium roseum]
MDSPKDVVMNDGESDTHKPFTIEENIRQLNDVDKDVVQLMNHMSTALNMVSVPQSSSGTPNTSFDPEDQKDAFKANTSAFLSTLHSIDVRLKRQIFALEEAGMVDLSAKTKAQSVGVPKASLKPNGFGAVGNLDVGWLNSQGSKVERDMESELWAKARAFIEKEGGNLKLD